MPTADFSPTMRLLGHALAYELPSRTRANARHVVLVRLTDENLIPLPNPDIGCSCEAGTMGGQCWAMTQVAQQWQSLLPEHFRRLGYGNG